MQSDKLDKKIKEAADHHHPAYAENAWQGMGKMLDLHLPVKKEKKRRFIFLLFFFLLLVGAGIWVIKSGSANPKKGIAEQSSKSVKTEAVLRDKINNLTGISIPGDQENNRILPVLPKVIKKNEIESLLKVVRTSGSVPDFSGIHLRKYIQGNINNRIGLLIYVIGIINNKISIQAASILFLIIL